MTEIASLILLLIILTVIIIHFLGYEIKIVQRFKSEPSVKEENNNFTIEYMPLSNRYYPRHNGYYLYYWRSGRWQLTNSITSTEYSSTEKGAKEIYDRYLEQVGITSIIIQP